MPSPSTNELILASLLDITAALIQQTPATKQKVITTPENTPPMRVLIDPEEESDINAPPMRVPENTDTTEYSEQAPTIIPEEKTGT